MTCAATFAATEPTRTTAADLGPPPASATALIVRNSAAFTSAETVVLIAAPTTTDKAAESGEIEKARTMLAKASITTTDASCVVIVDIPKSTVGSEKENRTNATAEMSTADPAIPTSVVTEIREASSCLPAPIVSMI